MFFLILEFNWANSTTSRSKKIVLVSCSLTSITATPFITSLYIILHFPSFYIPLCFYADLWQLDFQVALGRVEGLPFNPNLIVIVFRIFFLLFAFGYSSITKLSSGWTSTYFKINTPNTRFLYLMINSHIITFLVKQHLLRFLHLLLDLA